jgi:hypothetical protein
MSPEKERAIFERWPHWFTSKGDVSRSLLSRGFCCEDGWYGIIWDLFLSLEPLSAGLDPTGPAFEVVQVKEKFGGLRVGVSQMDDAIHLAIASARERSVKTCEICGNPGSLNEIW